MYPYVDMLINWYDWGEKLYINRKYSTYQELGPPYNLCAIIIDYYIVATLDTIRAKTCGSRNLFSPLMTGWKTWSHVNPHVYHTGM